MTLWFHFHPLFLLTKLLLMVDNLYCCSTFCSTSATLQPLFHPNSLPSLGKHRQMNREMEKLKLFGHLSNRGSIFSLRRTKSKDRKTDKNGTFPVLPTNTLAPLFHQLMPSLTDSCFLLSLFLVNSSRSSDPHPY